MAKVAWLHISDLHFERKKDTASSAVQEAFLTDLKKIIKDEHLRLNFVFFTGDLAYHGQTEEYKIAARFLDEVLAVAGISAAKDRLLIIPGNHEVNQACITQLGRKAITLLQDRNSVDQLLQNATDRRLVFRRFNPYRKFLRSYLGCKLPAQAGREPYTFTKVVTIDGVQTTYS